MKLKRKKSVKFIVTIVVTIVVAAAVMVPSSFNRKVAAANDCVIDVTKQNQKIKGFGGMNFPSWAGDLTAGQRETAFGNGEKQLGFTILRIHVDENKNNWSKELETAKSAVKHGAIVFASPWNPPSNMTEKVNDGRDSNYGNKRLKPSKYSEYAAYLNEFVTYMRNNGVDLYAISIQNEPDYAKDWTGWTPQEMYNFVRNYAGSIDCKVIAPESFQYRKNMSDPILNDSKALSNIDILGTHFYGTSIKDMSYPLFQEKGAGKELWMTEVYVPNSSSSADKWPEAIDVSYNMHNALKNGFQSYVWWYIRRSYGPIKEDGNISKRGYCMAQYSKYVRPGYTRIDATEQPQSNIYISAYKGDNNTVVIVAINKGTSALNQNFVINNSGTLTNVDRYRTSQNENLANSKNMAKSNHSFWAHLPANSVSTFVCTMSNMSK